MISCQHGSFIPDIEGCAEIPFVDGAEGACVTTLSKNKYIIPKDEWKEKRPRMIMVEAKEFSKVKKEWKKQCRFLGERCNLILESVEDVVNSLDQILEKYFKGKK